MTAAVILLAALVFCAMILSLAAKPKFTKQFIGFCALFSAAGGLLLYGIGFACVLDDPVQQVIRTVLNVCRMYAGVHNFAEVSAAPIFNNRIVLILFWLVHLMAFYTTTSAAISTLGAAALRRLKFWLQRYGDSVIIYGISDDTVEFGRSLMAEGVHNITYVGSKPDASCEAAINAAGGLVRSDYSALNPDEKFLKSLGSHTGKPKLTLYALDADGNRNQAYASALLEAMRKAGVDTGDTRLVMRSADDSVESGLAQTADRYGYGDVRNFTNASLAARLLMQSMPPCEKLDFNEDGSAQGDFDAVVVGFGKTGRTVLRYLIRNAQFVGSHFRAAVFSPNAQDENGYFCNSNPGLVEAYDIQFCNTDAKSRDFYSYLRSHAATIRYVVVCTGSLARDNELVCEISAFLAQLGCDAAVCLCSGRGISWCARPGEPMQYRNVCSAGVIGSDTCDRMAMMLNYSYVNDKNITPQQAWAGCDYFSRESSRASADFIRAFLRITGTTEDALGADSWQNKSPELLENLGITEHLRWCAFHYSMGFVGMPEEILRARGQRYQSEVADKGSSKLRITKDLSHRMHACLCSWEDLEKLSRIEESFTGKYIDYKDMDIRNVLALPNVLRAAKE